MSALFRFIDQYGIATADIGLTVAANSGGVIAGPRPAIGDSGGALYRGQVDHEVSIRTRLVGVEGRCLGIWPRPKISGRHEPA